MSVQTKRLRLHGETGADSDEILRRSPIWLAMGFRPFFLSAAAYAAVATAAWLHALRTGYNPSGSLLPLNLWHAHEMVFGFTLAVVAGFLLTAARNWTGRNTVHGWPLFALWLLWLAGRASMLGLLPLPAAAIALLQIAFPIALLCAVGRVIVQARSRRNYGVLAVLTLFAFAAVATHMQSVGLSTWSAGAAIHGALHLLILLNVVIGARIIPLFTRNRVGDPSIHGVPALDRVATAAAALTVPLAVLDVGGVRAVTPLLVGVATVSGVLQLARMRTWGVAQALRIPMLAVLHVGYAWIGIGQLLLAASLVLPGLSETVALHALTIGTIGMMTLGMMARVTLGHTGRAIESGPALQGAFVMMGVAALARLSAEVLPASLLVGTWFVSGSLFVLALLVYLIAAWKPLTTPRPDGKAG